MKAETPSCYIERPGILTGVASQPLVSVIVPVYKVEDVLARCIDSLCRQSLRDIDILLVDDASPDRCGEICEEYASKDARIRVFHHMENRGLSAARNTGIAHATAEYLMFVDSDDWVHVDFCRLPYKCAVQQQADLVIFRHSRGNNHKSSGNTNASKQNPETAALLQSGVKTKVEALDLMLFAGVGIVAWNKLYHRTLFKSGSISYPVGRLYEDLGTTYKTVLQSSRIYYLDAALYNKCNYDGSITTLKTEKALRDWIEMYLQQYRDLAAWGYPPDKLESLVNDTALTYLIQKKPDAGDTNSVFCRNKLQSAKKIPDNFTWQRKVLFVFLKYCPPLFDLVCEMWGKRWG